MASLTIHPSPLKGKVSSQPSKSMAHRAVICAALSEGESVIDNITMSDDICATINAVKALGTEILVSDSRLYAGRKCVTVRSSGTISIKNNIIDCHESGSTARFIMPITRLVSDRVTITGRGRLIERPFSVYKSLFTEKGVKYTDNDGKMPIILEGKLKPGSFEIPGDISSQFVSGLLFVLPLLDGPSRIIITTKPESLPYIRMTLKTLEDFGIKAEHDEDYRTFDIQGNQSYRAKPYYAVEGDWSQAAFFCVMGSLSEGILIEGLKLDSLQGDKAILDILREMGASPEIRDNGIYFSKSELKCIDVDASQIPDLVPIISVAAALARGTTNIRNAARLRIKESDRLAATCRELGSIGADIIEKEDGLIIHGKTHLSGGRADGCGDHRIVMSLAAASAASQKPVEINGYEAVKKSYPGFWEDFRKIGGRVKIHE